MQEIKYIDGRYPFAAGADYSPGDMIVRPDGTLAILDGLDKVATGDLIQPQPLVPTQIVEMDAASATTFAAGATVYFDTATQLANATNTNPRVGVAARAKTAGQTKVLVNCTPA